MGVVRCLLHHPQAMASLNHRDADGRTALYWACYDKGDDGVVRLLLEAGADAMTGNNDGETPMAIAARQGHDVCVELLEVREGAVLLEGGAGGGV